MRCFSLRTTRQTIGGERLVDIDNNPSTKCAVCPAGRQVDVNHTEGRCVVCPEGTTDSGPRCSPCPPGTTSQPGSAGWPACRACEAGTHSRTAPKDVDVLVRGGSVVAYQRCVACEARGTYSSANQTECVMCAPGTSSSKNHKWCNACPEGKHSNKVQMSSGQDGEDLVQQLCAVCPLGRHSDGGTSWCRNCSVGTADLNSNNKVSLECVPCAVGEYQDEEGQQRCRQCPEHETTTATGMGRCVCSAGYFRQAAGSCARCKVGSVCLGGAEGAVLPKPEFWIRPSTYEASGSVDCRRFGQTGCSSWGDAASSIGQDSSELQPLRAACLHIHHGGSRAGFPDLQLPNLVLDLRARDYKSGSTWPARVGPAAKLYGTPRFDSAQASVFFDTDSQWADVPLSTDGHDLPKVSYSIWLKLPHQIPHNVRGWAMSQSPDQHWSRAIALNDWRLSRVAGVSITVGSNWQNSLPKPPVGSWFHVVATWHQNGRACAYLNGVEGLCHANASNGQGTANEKLILGGRSPKDSSHNPSVMVGDVRVYADVLSPQSAKTLYDVGRDVGGSLSSQTTANSSAPEVSAALCASLNSSDPHFGCRPHHHGLLCSACDEGFRNVKGTCQRCDSVNGRLVGLMAVSSVGIGVYLRVRASKVKDSNMVSTLTFWVQTMSLLSFKEASYSLAAGVSTLFDVFMLKDIESIGGSCLAHWSWYTEWLIGLFVPGVLMMLGLAIGHAALHLALGKRRLAWVHLRRAAVQVLLFLYGPITLKCLQVFRCAQLPADEAGRSLSVKADAPWLRCWRGELLAVQLVAGATVVLVGVGMPLLLVVLLRTRMQGMKQAKLQRSKSARQLVATSANARCARWAFDLPIHQSQAFVFKFQRQTGNSPSVKFSLRIISFLRV